jgi:regulator of RNase E activity RraA
VSGGPAEVSGLTAAAVADACVRLGVAFGVAPAEMRRLEPGGLVVGPALPCRHAGSADVFLEAIESSSPMDVLVIDNEGRTDEGCSGDLVAIEAREAGLGGIVVWGLHRDSAEIRALGVSTWSLGSVPVGPRELRPAPVDRLERAQVGEVVVTRESVVVADDDGVLFVPLAHLDAVLDAARGIVETERHQSELAAAGTTLREQLHFAEYLQRRRLDPSYDFRRHLRESGGAIET